MNYQPLAILLLFYISGILSYFYYPNLNEYFYYFSALIFLILLLFLAIKNRFILKIHFIPVFILLFLLGIFNTYYFTKKTNNHFSNHSSKSVDIIEFQLDEMANSSAFYKKYFVNVERISNGKKFVECNGNLLLKIPQKKFKLLKFGQSYIAMGKIKEIPSNKNPIPFDYRAYLARNKIYYEIKTDTIIEQNKTKLSYFQGIKNIKVTLISNLEKSKYSNHSKEILRAITFGDRSDMEFESFQIFSKTGIIHILAISGMHILLIFQLFIFLMNRFSIHSPNKAIIIFALVFTWLYGFILGFQSSVFRAVLMITIYYIFYFLNRKPDIYHTLALSAFIILILNPLQIFDVGFQLSFVAVFFIVWLTKPIKIVLAQKKKWSKKILSFIAITLSAQIGTLPLSLYYFHQYSLLSLLANFIIIPYSTILIYLSFICVFQIILFPEFYFLSSFYNLCVDLLYGFIEFLVSFESMFFTKIPFNFWEMLALTLSVIYLKFLLQKPILRRFIVFLSLLLVFQLTRFYFDYKEILKHELVVFNQFKNTIISIKNKNSVHYFIKDTTQLSNTDYYLLKPYALQKRDNNYKIHFLEDTISGKSENIILFKNEKVLILNRKFSEKFIENFTYVLVSNSPKIDWNKINYSKIKCIVFDANNYPKYVDNSKNGIINNSKKCQVWVTNIDGAFVLR